MRLTPFLALAAASTLSTSAGAQAWVYTIPGGGANAIARSLLDDGPVGARAALGVGTRATGTLRDTLGLMIT